MKSIYSKLFVGFLLTLLLTFSLTGFFVIRQNNSSTDELTMTEIKNACEHVSNLMLLIDNDNLQKVLNDYAQTSGISFTIYDNENEYNYGPLIHQEYLTDKKKENLKNTNNKTYADVSGSYAHYAKSYTINDHIIIVSAQKNVAKSKEGFAETYLLTGIILLISGSFVFLIVSDFIVKPISNLTKATKELAQGNYNVRVNTTGNDEIANLNNAFNQMAIQLAKQDETRQQFISDVSHEFQTPLTSIQGFTTILKNEQLPSVQREKYADIILFQTKRLSTLSKNMLHLTLLEREDVELEIESFSLIEQMERVIETQDYQAKSKDIEIEFNKPKNDIMIEADQSRMEQVWINLINNAIKYTDEHGVVTIDINKGKEIEVKIQDTGIGMSQETISHIFERFYRNDKSRNIEGNGLGLSIVKRIIDLHDFRIDITSQVDVGTVFTVYIPTVSRRSLIVNKLKKDR